LLSHLSETHRTWEETVSADQTKSEFVKVSAERLLQIVKAILDAKMEKRILKKYGKVTLTIALKDAEAIKRLVQGASAKKGARAKKAPTTPAGRMTMAADRRLSRAMPADFDHCPPG
jgi:hypothetical protein